MIFSNLMLSGFRYGVDNPGLLTVLNDHVVTCFGRSKPQGGTKLLTETQFINFQYKRAIKSEKSVRSNVIQACHNPTEYYAFSSNIFSTFQDPRHVSDMQPFIRPT